MVGSAKNSLSGLNRNAAIHNGGIVMKSARLALSLPANVSAGQGKSAPGSLVVAALHPLCALLVLLLALCWLPTAVSARTSDHGSSHVSSSSGHSTSGYGGGNHSGGYSYGGGNHSGGYGYGGGYYPEHHGYGDYGRRWHYSGPVCGISYGIPIYSYPVIVYPEYSCIAPGWTIADDVPIYSCPPPNVTVVVNETPAATNPATSGPVGDPPAPDIAPTAAPVVTPTPAAVAPLTGVTVTANPEAPQKAKTPITLKATAAGGSSSSMQYQFWLCNPATHTWTQLQAYSANATCTWTPAKGGNYILSISAKDLESGSEENVLNWYTVQ